MRHFGFVPLSKLLPHTAALVHHGGIGSCAQGLAAGVPHIVRPMSFDQFDNSRRLVRLGVAEEISVRKFSRSSDCRGAGADCWHRQRVAAKCRELAAALRRPGRAAPRPAMRWNNWPISEQRGRSRVSANSVDAPWSVVSSP